MMRGSIVEYQIELSYLDGVAVPIRGHPFAVKK